MPVSLKEIRQSYQLTQNEAAKLLDISLRSYKSYENEVEKQGTTKYRFLAEELKRQMQLDEEHGVLTLEQIREGCRSVLANYSVDYCYLFGSYARGEARPDSDVDLLIAGDIDGMRFFGLVEALREALHKPIDLLDLRQLEQNVELLNEILKEGIKIYEKS